MDTLHPQETVGDGAARVAGSGDKDMDSALAGRELPEQPRHEARAHILEGQCWPMEKFQGINPRFHRHERAVKRECFLHNAPKDIGRDILSKESRCHLVCNLHEGALPHRAEKRIRKAQDPLRHIQPAVLRETIHDRLAQVRQRCPAIGAVVSHCARSLAPLFVTFTTYTSHLMPCDTK